MARPRILFLVNGLGLGNSTRCHAVMQRLLRRGAEIQIVTSGNGLWYFRSMPELAQLHEVESLYYGVKDGRISIARTLSAIADFAGIMRRNARKIAAVLDSWRPHLAVADSVYTFRAFKRRGIPLIALNNADVVRASYRRFADRPASISAQFWCVEEPDYLFSPVCCRTSPSARASTRPLAESGGNIRRVGPIVREAFRFCRRGRRQKACW
jgi:UDP:flavonoid glycosyltransferase YjiC (YdhE family)